MCFICEVYVLHQSSDSFTIYKMNKFVFRFELNKCGSFVYFFQEMAHASFAQGNAKHKYARLSSLGSAG
jgi:hypothetical protein